MPETEMIPDKLQVQNVHWGNLKWDSGGGK